MRVPAEPGPAGAGQVSGASRLRAEIRSRSGEPYLVTVTPEAAPHCGTASVTWGAREGELTVVPVPRTWAEAAGFRTQVRDQVAPHVRRTTDRPHYG